MFRLNSKTLLCGLLFALISLEIQADDMQDLIDNLHKTCVEETGASEDLIAAAKIGNFADDENLKCYIKCIMDQMACIDDDGIVDIEGVTALLPDDKANLGKAVVKCGTKVGKSPCENAWLTNQCWFKECPTEYFLP